ncbi:MAG: hypothetical protein J6B60_05550 [Clostridia bacterium]|nr:hypothetical protein [Clostridia bacterium]
MKLLKSKKEYIFFLCVVIACVFPLVVMEFSTDTYHFALVSLADGLGAGMKYNGRFITSLSAYALDAVGFGIVGYYYFSLICAVLCLSLAIYHIYIILKGKMRGCVAAFLSFVTVFNPLTIEFFLFIEKGAFAFAILMSVLSAKSFVCFLKGDKKRIIFSYIYLTFGACTYQLLSAAFVTLALVFIVIYSRSIKDFVINNLLAVTVYGFANCVDFVLLKIFNPSNVRMSGEINLSNILKYYFITEREWVIFIYIALFAVVFCAFGFLGKRRFGSYFAKGSVVEFGKYFYIFTGTALAAAVPFIFVNPVEVWMMFRTTYALGVLPGAIAIKIFYKPDGVCEKESSLFEKKKRRGSIIMLTIIFVELVFFHTMIFSRLKNNFEDERLCEQIGLIIRDYEVDTGERIKYISIYYDAKITQRNDGVLMIGDCNVRAFSRTWSDVNHMSYLLGRSFVRIENNPEYTRRFSSLDWNDFSKDQLIFEGNTLHLCVY